MISVHYHSLGGDPAKPGGRLLAGLFTHFWSVCAGEPYGGASASSGREGPSGTHGVRVPCDGRERRRPGSALRAVGRRRAQGPVQQAVTSRTAVRRRGQIRWDEMRLTITITIILLKTQQTCANKSRTTQKWKDTKYKKIQWLIWR